MSSNKPSLPKGTRDFSPIEMARRNYIFDTIKKVYKKYGFQQIETPAMENLSTLVGTGGDESDKLIFKILNSGDYLAKADEKALKEKNANGLTKSIAEKALHYDLTVPFARYVVQNQNEITFPFRRFQIQPVWRADRPQKGRYREFYQCDADIIGSDSLLNEVDLIKIIDDVFTKLFTDEKGNTLPYTISINNRKILQGITESVGLQDKFEQIVVAIDKFDKVGEKGVYDELVRQGLKENQIESLLNLLFSRKLSNYINNIDNFPKDGIMNLSLADGILNELKDKIGGKLNADEGIGELKLILKKLINLEEFKLGLKTANVIFDPTLARGLGYYTGTIIEVKVDNFPSICGGGRYDDLTGKFGLKDVSGVGISFGADRIYDVLLDNNLYPKFEGDSTQVLFVNFGEKEQDYCLPLLFQLRDKDINAEIYPEAAKLKKQMTFANNKNINYVVLVGSDEMASGKLTVKNMKTGEQHAFTIVELIQELKK
ncbi:MAG: histidine--tRNA ligase [Flavobacteriales bacterium]|nr:histidine--tRNA ligase [Flavobacteriales bacterium]MCW8912817.1 histidine--tRNA ligase [Flavobacteriales bacterium]MCW8938821.1 histidine--tRNA ligase [Flavobacteriales bacterium]MCW8939180.1 histidine--tRNA ligase [Flavobacteriales bacterium]MCW8989475.1 histidine--tRNA ligase [Flavobacteriales bacterium]